MDAILRSPRVRNARGANAEQAETAVTPHVSAEIRNSIPDESEVSVVEYHRARSTLADRLRRKD
jgi:hypothetical protein